MLLTKGKFSSKPKPPESVSVQEQMDLHSLRVANFVLFLVHTANFVALLILSASFNFSTSPVRLSDTDLVSVNLVHIAVLVEFVSAFRLAYTSTTGTHRYEAALARGCNDYRWLEYTLTAPLSTLMIALLTGVSDLALLFALMAISVLSVVLAYVHDMEPPNKAALFRLGFGSCVSAWVIVYMHFVDDWAVYVVNITLLLLDLARQFIQWRKVNARQTEWMFLGIELVSKMILAWIVFVKSKE